MQVEFHNATTTLTLIADTKHDAYDLGALFTALKTLPNDRVTVIFEHETQDDYIALEISL